MQCWIAPRDIQQGMEWAANLVEAILRSRVLMLLLSRAANKSPYVHREVERAVSREKPVLTVRLEDICPADKLELFIASAHWFDAFPQPLA